MEQSLIEIIGGILTITYLRYFIIAGIFFLIFYVLFKKKWQSKKIQNCFPKNKDYKREIGYSILSLFIFMLVGLVAHKSPIAQWSLRYDSIAEYGTAYWFLSVILMIFLHDTYFYWTHRAMHHPKIYRSFHKVHHQSTNPSPWAAFAFHPLEGVVEAGIIFPIIFFIPHHFSAVFAFLIFMTVYNVYGHLGYEIFPKGFNKNRIGKWHHAQFNGNFGLYFLFWDRWMGTLRTDYDSGFKEVDQLRTSSKAIQ